MNATERRLIGYITAAHALAHVIELAYPVLLTRIEQDFGIRALVSGTLATIFGWSFGTTAIPAGFLTDRLGSRQVLVYGFAGASVMAVLAGLAPNEWFLAAALAGLGLTAGLYHPAGLSAIAQGVRQRGMALGYHGAAGNLGQAVTPLLLATIVAAIFDWRAGFFVVAALSAILALVLATTHLPVHGDSETLAPAEALPEPAIVEGRSHRLVAPLLVTYGAFV